MIVAGFIVTAVKLYDVSIPGKGEYNSGYKAGVFQNSEISIFYPTKENTKKKGNWFPNKNYLKTFYEIFYVNP